jgi:uncharacterized membrane protein
MEFVLWSSKAVHILSAIVWIGGLIYYNAVLTPVLAHEGKLREGWLRASETRFQGFIWSVATPALVTGGILLIFQPKLATIAWDDAWTLLMAAKILMLACMTFFGWQAGVVIRRLKEVGPEAEEEEFLGWYRSLQRVVRRSIVCGIAAVLAATSLMFV